MLPPSPLVSAVIPTYLRPDLVLRAIRSALGQTVQDIEVIVVVDGRDAQTCAALQGIDDARLVVVVPERHLGNADARNACVSRARAKCVAFLDDDDEWLPNKLAAQLRTWQRSGLTYPIVTCRMIGRSETGDVIWPRRLPAPGEPLSEFFFCRRTPFTGEGMVINSAILTSRELLRLVPFRSGLERHVDPDWLLRAIRLPGTGLEFVPQLEPQLIWYIEQHRDRITTRRDWRGSLAYAGTNRDLFTARGYAAFVLHVVSGAAAAQRDRAAFFLLLNEAFTKGRPAPVDLVSHFGNFLLPTATQRWAAKLFSRIAAGHRTEVSCGYPAASHRRE